MRLDRSARASGPLVTGFSGSGFKIDGVATPGGVLLTPAARTPAWWRPWDGVLDEAALEPLTDMAPEFILLGTGETLTRPSRALTQALEARGIGIEAMDSRAAARAWGVLRGEDRRIGAALAPL